MWTQRSQGGRLEYAPLNSFVQIPQGIRYAEQPYHVEHESEKEWVTDLCVCSQSLFIFSSSNFTVDISFDYVRFDSAEKP